MVVTSICGGCQPDYSGMSGVVGYLYQSAKDSIKWHNLKPKDFINLIMSIGRLVYLSDEDFNKLDVSKDKDIINVDNVNNFALMMQKIKGDR